METDFFTQPMQGPSNTSTSEHIDGPFETVPTADYDDRTISDYSLKDNFNKANKALADSLDKPETYLDFFNPMKASIAFTKGVSSLTKTRYADDLWVNDPRFKQGVTDHVNAKDRHLFENNEREYLDSISGQVKPTHTPENLEPIHRGVKVEPGSELESLKPGDYMTSNEVESFSWDQKVADRFSIPLSGSPKTQSYQFHLVDRQSGIDLPKLTNHNAWSESEVVMPAGAKYEIIDIEEIDGVKHFHIGEAQTVPSGSKLYTRDNMDANDYTDEDAVNMAIQYAEDRSIHYKDRIPSLSDNYGANAKKMKAKLTASKEAANIKGD